MPTVVLPGWAELFFLGGGGLRRVSYYAAGLWGGQRGEGRPRAAPHAGPPPSPPNHPTQTRLMTKVQAPNSQRLVGWRFLYKYSGIRSKKVASSSRIWCRGEGSSRTMHEWVGTRSRAVTASPCLEHAPAGVSALRVPPACPLVPTCTAKLPTKKACTERFE